MDGVAAILKLVLDFLGLHIGPVFGLVSLFLFRKPLVGLIDRAVKFNFKFGDASGNVEALPPPPDPHRLRQDDLAQKLSQPASTEPALSDLKQKEEEAKDWFPEMRAAFVGGDISKAKQVFEAHQRMESDADL